MRITFLDESGYTFDWKSGIEEQPFYSFAAVCMPADRLPDMYARAREAVESLNLPGQALPLGQGFEIRAREIAKGGGWWQAHNQERDAIRTLMLGLPKEFGGIGIVVVIDKEAHLEK